MIGRAFISGCVFSAAVSPRESKWRQAEEVAKLHELGRIDQLITEENALADTVFGGILQRVEVRGSNLQIDTF